MIPVCSRFMMISSISLARAVSMFAVASSKMMNRDFARIALAIAIRCISPPEKLTPFPSTSVSKCCGSLSTSSFNHPENHIQMNQKSDRHLIKSTGRIKHVPVQLVHIPIEG